MQFAALQTVILGECTFSAGNTTFSYIVWATVHGT